MLVAEVFAVLGARRVASEIRSTNGQEALSCVLGNQTLSGAKGREVVRHGLPVGGTAFAAFNIGTQR